MGNALSHFLESIQQVLQEITKCRQVPSEDSCHSFGVASEAQQPLLEG